MTVACVYTVHALVQHIADFSQHVDSRLHKLLFILMCRRQDAWCVVIVYNYCVIWPWNIAHMRKSSHIYAGFAINYLIATDRSI